MIEKAGHCVQARARRIIAQRKVSNPPSEAASSRHVGLAAWKATTTCLASGTLVVATSIASRSCDPAGHARLCCRIWRPGERARQRVEKQGSKDDLLRSWPLAIAYSKVSHKFPTCTFTSLKHCSPYSAVLNPRVKKSTQPRTGAKKRPKTQTNLMTTQHKPVCTAHNRPKRRRLSDH
jgi:hypothetical protein